MDDMLLNDSLNNHHEDSDYEEESLVVSDNPSRCSSLPLQKLQTVTRILRLSENETPTPEMRATQANSDGVWLGEFEYDKSNHKAIFRSMNLETKTVEKKRNMNVKTSNKPQTVAARKRKEKFNEKLKTLRRLVPGGSQMDTATMLDGAVNYLKFLKAQIKAFESLSHNSTSFNSTNFPLNPYRLL